MKMLRSLSPLACMAFMLAAAAPLAHADVMGTVYINQAPFPAPLTAPPYTGTNASFSVSAIDFNAVAGSGYTINGFLTSHGATVTPGANYTALAGNDLNNTIFDFKGSTYLAAGTYTVTHDDGALLFLNGNMTNVLTPTGSGNPTSAADSFFTIATGGTYGFELDYAEVNGAPAVLDAPFASTPEPSSFILLGSGLIAAAGMVRRRMTA